MRRREFIAAVGGAATDEARLNAFVGRTLGDDAGDAGSV